VYQQNPTRKKPASFLGQVADIVYFYDELATITGIRADNHKVVMVVKTGLPPFVSQNENTPAISDNIIQGKTAFWINKVLYYWDLQNGKLLSQSLPLDERASMFLHLLPGGKAVYYDHENPGALQCWDFATATNKKLVIDGRDNVSSIYRLNILSWNNKFLISINNNLYETDSTFWVLKSELVNFQNQPVASNNGISDIVTDNVGNIYLQTISGGIRKIIRNNYPVKYYGTLSKEENSIISLLPDKKNNRVLAGTNGYGLLIFDTLQHLTRRIQALPGRNLPFGVSAILKDNKGDYLLYITGENRIWRLTADLSTLSSTPVSYADSIKAYGINYFATVIHQDTEKAIIQSMFRLYRTDFITQKTTTHWVSSEYVLGRLWYNDNIIFHANDELITLDGQTFKEIKKIPFPNTGGVRCIIRDAYGNILMGTNKGIFKTDGNGNILYQWNKENGLPDECIYAIAIDKNEDMWCSSNKGIFRINKDNYIFHLTREDGFQENEFNSNIVAQTEDGELFFGGVNGVSSFFPSSINSFDETIQILLTRIRVNNMDLNTHLAPWNTDKIKLNYSRNSLSFDFVAMANNNPAQYIYQYRMKGIDKEWLQNTGLQTVRYSLPPGKYVLQLYASRSFDRNAKPMKELAIIISPPFWKTWWFRIGSSLVLVTLLTYAINQRNKRKYAKKLQQLENERQIKQERERISKDLHDSLGAYANAVLHNTDLLEKEKGEQKRTELIGGLKFASKDIITSLRETVWALKKESYTAEDCLVRIRNFIQPFTRYYEHIHFRVIGEAPADHILHYTKALNLVRIVQEAISNSIKHASPSSIQVTSSVNNDQWKLVIVDDGKGFDQAAARKTEQGNGLHNMEHRAAETGFDLTLETKPGSGTIITIVV
jgi:signal transduction histidine kinase